MCCFHCKYFSRTCFLPKNSVGELYTQSSEHTKVMHGKCQAQGLIEPRRERKVILHPICCSSCTSGTHRKRSNLTGRDNWGKCLFESRKILSHISRIKGIWREIMSYTKYRTSSYANACTEEKLSKY